MALLFLQRWPTPPHFIELLVHFYPQGIVLWASLALIFVMGCFFIPVFKVAKLAGRWQNLSFFLLLLALLLPLQPYMRPAFGTDPGPAAGPALRIVLANVLFTNSDTEAFALWLHQQQADVVVIEELNRSYEALMQGQQSYPYHRVVYTGDPFGIGVWSRIPFVAEDTVRVGPAHLPSLYLQFQTPRPFHLVATHPYPPISGAYFRDRNAQYEALAAFLADKQGVKVVVGDLNITPWSGYYQQWTQKLGIHNSREGQGLLPSWPVHWPALLRIPIDDVLISDGIENASGGQGISAETTLGPEIGSDHLPVHVVLRWPLTP